MRGARLGYIDTIRGLAALAVIYYHCAEHLLKTGQAGSGVERTVFVALTQHVDIGKVAVLMFFAVSGFVVPYSLDAGGRSPVRDFAISRAFRLYPAYWVSILLGIWAFYGRGGRDIAATTVLANLTMLQQFAGFENIIGLYWTLQIELIFYGLCVMLFWAGLLQRPRGLAAAAAAMLGAALGVAVARHHLGKPLPVALPLALAIMLWGALWRSWLVEARAEARAAALGILALILAAVPVIALIGYGRDLGYGATWYRYAASYWVALLLFVLMTTVWRLEGPVLAWLGAASYGLYLFGPVAQEAVIAVAQSAGLSGYGHGMIVATMILAVALAAPVHHVVERPCIRLGRRLVADLKRDSRAGLGQPFGDPPAASAR